MEISRFFKIIRGSLLSAALGIPLFPHNAEAKFPLNVFKKVDNCLFHNRKYLSPAIGMAALDGAVMENIRFYGNFEAAWRQTKEGPERDYANDTSNDPVWQLVRILFPSTAGQLSGDSAHRYNFGKHVKDPKTIALLINYADDVRTGKMVDEEHLKNDLMASMGFILKDKLSPAEKETMAKNLLNRDRHLINDILMEVQSAEEKYNNINTQDQHSLGEAKNSLLQSLAKKAKRLSNPKITALFMDEIRELYGQDSYSHPKYHPSRKPLVVKPTFFHDVLTEMTQAKMAADNVLDHTPMAELIAYVEKREPKHKFIAHLKEETLTPLLSALKEAILAEHPKDQGFYPKYTPEQALLAFLAYKFSTREDLKTFLTHLKPQFTIKPNLNAFDPSDLLQKSDLPEIANKKMDMTVDDILALSTADIWVMPTPYRVGAPILSNGNTRKYDRKTDSFVPGTFADCVEISIRHLINCFLYDPIARQFNFKGLAEYQAHHPLPPAQMANFAAFMNFYKMQSVDHANDGNIEIRSQWNRVVGDLNTSGEPDETKIRYRQETNELDAGFINLMKVFHKVLGIHLKPAPLAKSSLDDKKKWLEESFKEVFKALNPHEEYTIRVNMDKVKAEGSEISGVITLSIYNKQGMLYAFDFRSNPDHHGQLQNYRVSDRLKTEDYTPALKENYYDRIGSINAIWLLAKDPQVLASKNVPAFYKWFEISLGDNEARIGFLKKANDLTKKSPLPDPLKNSLQNTISDLSLDDTNTFEEAAPILWEFLNRDDTKYFVRNGLKSAKFGNNYSYLSDNPDMVGVVLEALFLNNSTLTSLSMAVNNIGDEGAVALSKVLKTNTSLTSLNLLSNKIGAKGAVALSEVLAMNKTLTSLGLTQNNIGVEGVVALLQAKALTDLNLQRNKLGDDGAVALSHVLATNTTLTSLSLYENNIGAKGAEALSQALATNTTLTNLNLQRNKLDDDGVAALSKGLATNRTLTSLMLEANSIGAKGAEALSQALKFNTSLTSLMLGANSIGAEGAVALSKGLATNRTLTSLDLYENSIGDEGMAALSQALAANRTLTVLSLNNNKIGDEGMAALSQALAANRTLTVLSLRNNKIGVKGAVALSKGLATNRTLTSLDLRGNNIGAEGIAALSQALAVNTTLTSLHLSRNGMSYGEKMKLEQAFPGRINMD